MADIKKSFAKKYGGSIEQINTLLDQIKQVETNNKDIEQKGGGPGRGFYQFEKTSKNKKGEYIQAGAMTARNRLKNLYIKLGKNVPEWLTQTGMRDPSIGFNALGLSEEKQDDLLLADFYYKKVRGFDEEGKKKLFKDAFESGDSSKAWVHAHWAGPEKNIDEKLAQFKRNVKIDKSIAGDNLVEQSKKKDSDQTDQKRAENGVFKKESEANATLSELSKSST